MRSTQFLFLSSLIAMTACATGEVLDETRNPLGSSGGADGEGGSPGGGSTGSGGKSSSTGGGVASTGGISSGSGGASSTGGIAQGGGSGECEPDEKLCDEACTPPAPDVGCGLTGCTPCPGPAPDHGMLACIGTACGFNCEAGYRAQGNDCVPSGAGGNTATGGAASTGGSKSTGGTSSGGGSSTGGTSTGGSKSTGGTGGATQCVPSACPPCNIAAGPPCCTPQNKCGCPIFYIPGTCG